MYKNLQIVMLYVTKFWALKHAKIGQIDLRRKQYGIQNVYYLSSFKLKFFEISELKNICFNNKPLFCTPCENEANEKMNISTSFSGITRRRLDRNLNMILFVTRATYNSYTLYRRLMSWHFFKPTHLIHFLHQWYDSFEILRSKWVKRYKKKKRRQN